MQILTELSVDGSHCLHQFLVFVVNVITEIVQAYRDRSDVLVDCSLGFFIVFKYELVLFKRFKAASYIMLQLLFIALPVNV